MKMGASMYRQQMKKISVKSPSRRRIDSELPEEEFHYKHSDRKGPDTTEQKESLKTIGERNSLFTKPELVAYEGSMNETQHPWSSLNREVAKNMVDGTAAENERRREEK